MIDGMLSGTVHSFGAYEQCLSSEAPSKDPDKPQFRGQYCQIEITPPLPEKYKRYKYDEALEELETFKGSEIMNFLAKKASIMYTFPYKVGLCVPSGCSLNDIDEVAKEMAGKFYLSATVKSCETSEPVHYSMIHYAAVLVCSILILIVVLCTGYEINLKNKGEKSTASRSKKDQVLISFSLISNFKELVSSKSSFAQLECIHGILFLGIVKAVLINTYVYPMFMMHTYHSLMSVYEMMRYPMGQMIINTNVVIDTFLVVSGCWICYMVLKLSDMQLEKFDLKLFVLYKLWRVVPVYYFIILMSMLTSLMGSGPNFQEAMKFSVENCKSYWWRNLLFINNFYDFGDMCLTHSWYISCDFQLYFSTLLVVLPLLKSRTFGLIINAVIVIGCIAYTGVITYYYDLIPGFDISYIDKDFRSETYIKIMANPLAHAGPYFIGVFIGYALMVKKDTKIPKKYQILGWFIAAMCFVYPMCWTIFWRHYTPSVIEKAIFSGLYRTVWATGIAWMTFCCCSGSGGIINSLLSWKPFFTLSRIVLLIFLIQPTLMIVYIGTFKATHEFTHFELIITCFGFLILSGLLALIGSFLVESPVIALEGVVFAKVKNALNSTEEESSDKHTNGILKSNTSGELEMNCCFDSTKCDYADNKAYEDTP